MVYQICTVPKSPCLAHPSPPGRGFFDISLTGTQTSSHVTRRTGRRVYSSTKSEIVNVNYYDDTDLCNCSIWISIDRMPGKD